MYGAIVDDDDNKAEDGPLKGSVDPLLPPREPSAAAESRSRKLQKRASKRALQAFSRRQLMAVAAVQEQGAHVEPVMKTLFHNSHKHHHNINSPARKQQHQQQPRISRKSTSKAGMDVEAGQALLPTNTASNNTAGNKTANTQNDNENDNGHNHQKLKKTHRHSWLYVLLHSSSRHPHAILYQKLISAVIVCDVFFFVASTEETWRRQMPKVFYYEEGIVSTLFLLEYLCRVYVAPESHKYHHHNTNLQARLAYMKTFPALVDLVAALPFFLELPTNLQLPKLTWLRFFRLLRILKTKSYATSLETVWRVIYYNREILYVALNMCILLVLVTSVLMYYLRPRTVDMIDNADFASLLATMYLSAMMLTGQGQPEGDLPWYTKGVVLLTGIFSVAMFAIPASMLTWGFEAEAERCARKARQKYVASLEDIPEDDNSSINDDEDDFSYADYISSSSSSEGDTTDEEYLNIIAGGDDDDDGQGEDGAKPGQDEVVKQLIRTFQTSDADASGALSMDEFIELMTDPSLVSQHTTMVGMATSMGILAKRVHQLERELTESHHKLDEILQAVRR